MGRSYQVFCLQILPHEALTGADAFKCTITQLQTIKQAQVRAGPARMELMNVVSWNASVVITLLIYMLKTFEWEQH